ncbi:hypothetical protein N7452_001434 [Penicillium brevicompactum]|uniref:Uncharacterized protein n=1 Tax=Penicillium brevicompactum TaxID=5074 RepID=A0A9W9R2I8_PENBR|nr:hypothetical protein N7452_001434 [Penicillium brevicompactum]
MAAAQHGGGPHGGGGQGQMMWDQLVKQHKQTNTFCRVAGSSRLVEAELGIYEGRGGMNGRSAREILATALAMQ